MSNPWAYALYIGALVALLLTWKTPRAWLWICVGAASFVASSLWWDYGDHHLHPMVTFFCDALVCLAFHLWTREKWELGLFIIYITSAFVSLLKIGGFIPDGLVYAVILELCNWVALMALGGVGLTDLINRYEIRVVHRVHTSLHRASRAF